MTEPERRPSFARDFPPSAELDALVAAFVGGDYARVRADGAKLAGSVEDQAIRDAARMLIERTRPDPLAVGLLVVTGVLLVALTSYWVVNGKAPPGGGPTRPSIERPH